MPQEISNLISKTSKTITMLHSEYSDDNILNAYIKTRKIVKNTLLSSIIYEDLHEKKFRDEFKIVRDDYINELKVNDEKPKPTEAIEEIIQRYFRSDSVTHSFIRTKKR